MSIRASSLCQAIIAASRKKYGTPRAEVEAALLAGIREDKPTASPPSPSKPVIPPSSPPPEPAKVAPMVEMPEPPPVAEVPKTIPPAQKKVAKTVASETPEPPRDLGRGGAQHKAIQKRIKEAAEKLNFRSIIEQPVLDGQGSVDLWLERGGQAIACEISISTTIDHEVRNVAKCLKSEVPKVAVICLDEERLRKITAAVVGSLGTEKAERVAYFNPDQFIAWLKNVPDDSAPKEKVVQRRGYRVKTVITPASAKERQEKEAAAIRAITESMRRK